MFLDFRFLIATVFHVPFLSWLGCNYSTQNCCTSGLDFRSQLHQVTMVALSRTSFHLTDSIWFSTEWIYCFTSHISSHSSVPKQINNLERWIWATWGQRRGWRKRFKIWREKNITKNIQKMEKQYQKTLQKTIPNNGKTIPNNGKTIPKDIFVLLC